MECGCLTHADLSMDNPCKYPAAAARVVELEDALRTMWMFFAGKAKTELPEKDYREIRNLLTPSIEDKKASR